ncbi:hypothetical protein PMIN04_008201 [Paraphaeosphaeria minitans]
MAIATPITSKADFDAAIAELTKFVTIYMHNGPIPEEVRQRFQAIVSTTASETGTPALPAQTSSLMQRILSSKPEGWEPSLDWVTSSEIAVHLSLWNVTCNQWTSAWQDMMKMKQLDKIRKAYGSENPYAWLGLEAGNVMKTDEQQGTLRDGKLPKSCAIQIYR